MCGFFHVDERCDTETDAEYIRDLDEELVRSLPQVWNMAEENPVSSSCTPQISAHCIWLCGARSSWVDINWNRAFLARRKGSGKRLHGEGTAASQGQPSGTKLKEAEMPHLPG